MLLAYIIYQNIQSQREKRTRILVDQNSRQNFIQTMY